MENNNVLQRICKSENLSASQEELLKRVINEEIPKSFLPCTMKHLYYMYKREMEKRTWGIEEPLDVDEKAPEEETKNKSSNEVEEFVEK